MATKTKQVMEEEIQNLENDWSNKEMRQSITRILETAMEEIMYEERNYTTDPSLKRIYLCFGIMEPRIQKILNSVKE